MGVIKTGRITEEQMHKIQDQKCEDCENNLGMFRFAGFPCRECSRMLRLDRFKLKK